jgi:16S rRNA (uracil1498-N3)-methyltransferase
LTGKALNHQRFYYPFDAAKGDVITFPSEESHHIVGSLRLRKGESVSCTDGAGRVYEVLIEEARKRNVKGSVTAVRLIPRDRPAITLCQGITKASYLEVALEKCAELGITEFLPVICRFSIGRLGPARLKRLRRIAVQAMKQSLGAYLVEVGEPVVFEDALNLSGRSDLQLVAWRGAGRRTLAEIMKQHHVSEVALWIGPEGGFAPDEVDALIAGGARTFAMGNHRLRAETAAISAVAIIRGLTRDATPRNPCCENKDERNELH